MVKNQRCLCSKQQLKYRGRSAEQQGTTYLGGLEGVVWCEGDVQEEHSSLIHGARGPQDGGPPLIDVVSFRAGTVDTHKHTHTKPVLSGFSSHKVRGQTFHQSPATWKCD